MHPLVRTFAEQACALGAGSPDSAIVLAVSGGPDSCALLALWCAAAVAGELPRPKVVAHLDHGMRGDQAQADAAWVHELASRLGVQFHGGRTPLAGANEAEARTARYEFLVETARRFGCTWVATGHTADDQAETVLMRVLRGTSPDGLAGIPATREISPGMRVIRPMLGMRRAELLEYLAEVGIGPRHDPTNDNPRYVRGRLRAQWGRWEDEFNPRLTDALCRLAEQAARDREILTELVEPLWQESERGDCLAVGAILGQPAGLRHRIWMRWLGNVVAPEHREAAATALHADGIERVASGECGSWTLPGSVTVVLMGDVLSVRAAATPSAIPPEGWSVDIEVPGRVVLPGGRVLHVAHDAPGGAFQQWRTAESGPGGWCVRSARDGDRVAPLGMCGSHRKVRDILHDMGIPADLRPGWPLVVCRSTGRVAWVVGGCVSDEFRVTGNTGQVHWWIVAN